MPTALRTKFLVSQVEANTRSFEAFQIDMDANRSDKLSFEDFQLPSGLLLGLYAMGFQHGPSDIQGLILPYSLSDQATRNIIVQSKTGTGKTVIDVVHLQTEAVECD